MGEESQQRKGHQCTARQVVRWRSGFKLMSTFFSSAILLFAYLSLVPGAPSPESMGVS